MQATSFASVCSNARTCCEPYAERTAHAPMFLPARPCLHTPLTPRNLIRLLEFHSSIYTTGDRLWARRLRLHTFLSFRCPFAPPTKSPRRQNLHPGKRDKRSGNFPTPDSFLCGAETDLVLPTRNIKNSNLDFKATSINPP